MKQTLRPTGKTRRLLIGIAIYAVLIFTQIAASGFLLARASGDSIDRFYSSKEDYAQLRSEVSALTERMKAIESINAATQIALLNQKVESLAAQSGKSQELLVATLCGVCLIASRTLFLMINALKKLLPKDGKGGDET